MSPRKKRRPPPARKAGRSGWPQPLGAILQVTQIILTLLRIMLDR